MVKKAPPQRRNTKRKAKSEAGSNIFKPLGRGKKIEPERLSLLKVMHLNGSNPTRIGRFCNILNLRTIKKWTERIDNGEKLEPKKRSGKPPVIVTPERVKQLQQYHQENQFTEFSVATFRAGFIKWEIARLKQHKKSKAARVPLTPRTFKKLMKKAELRSCAGQKKPIGMNCHREARLAAAKLRAKWTQKYIDGIIWIDQSCSQRISCGRFIVRKGQPRPFRFCVDPKDEKMHFMIGIGNGWKSPFESLKVKRPVLKDDNGNTIHRTLANGRRLKGQAGKANLPNQGETWTSERIISILTSRRWLPHLKKATGVVLDAQTRIHAPVIRALQKHGVKIITHPPCSPDLNLCEQAHKAVKKYTERLMIASNNEELMKACEDNWEEYDVADFARITGSYKKNVVAAIIAADGGATKY